MLIQHKSPPVNVAPLPESQIVAIQAGITLCMAVPIEEEREQNIVDLLRRCLNRIAEFLSVLLSNHKDTHSQPSTDGNRDGHIGCVVEFVRQWASIGQVNLTLAGAMVSNLAHIQLEVVEVLNECAFDVHN